MNKTIIYILASLFLLTSCLFAIDKKPQSEKPGNKQSQDSLKTDRPVAPDSSKTKIKPNDGADYNDFIDKNNNGIDDRVEKKKKAVDNQDASSSNK